MVAKKTSYLYNINDEINGLKIIKQKKLKNGPKYFKKGYVVQSLKYPDAPLYEVDEYYLKSGKGDQYLKRKVFVGNSLYSIKETRKNLINIAEAKTLHKHSKTYIDVKCENCDKVKNMRVEHLVRFGIMCTVCSRGTTYPELFFMAYNNTLNLNFVPQQTFEDFKDYRFDFVNYERRIIVEAHGIQHFEESGHMNHTSTVKSDEAKRKYCKENGWVLVELDFRESTFEFCRLSIDNTFLQNIDDSNVDDMLEFMELNKRYDVKNITKDYKDGLTINQISKKHNIPKTTINRILVKNNVTLRSGGAPKGSKAPNGKCVKCLNNGKEFESVGKAQEWAIQGSKISEVCKGNRKTAGTHPETGEKLRWEYV